MSHRSGDFMSSHRNDDAMSYGYPGVLTTTVEEEPYLCVSHDIEQTWIQPLRLAAGLVGGPVVIYAARQLPEEHRNLSLATQAIGASMSAWSLWVWWKAHTEMNKP